MAKIKQFAMVYLSAVMKREENVYALHIMIWWTQVQICVKNHLDRVSKYFKAIIFKMKSPKPIFQLSQACISF